MSAGQIILTNTCDNNFTGINIWDYNGNQLRRDGTFGTRTYNPHNFSGPTGAPRVGAEWSGTYNNFRNGQPNGSITKNCSVKNAEPYSLTGFPGPLTAYTVQCSFKSSEYPKPGTEQWKYIVTGGIPFLVEYASGPFDNNFEFKRLEFRPAGSQSQAQR
jgi:hypothetical protein